MITVSWQQVSQYSNLTSSTVELLQNVVVSIEVSLEIAPGTKKLSYTAGLNAFVQMMKSSTVFEHTYVKSIFKIEYIWNNQWLRANWCCTILYMLHSKHQHTLLIILCMQTILIKKITLAFFTLNYQRAQH